ncbi:MAG: F0F1 ATP synthase subunit A [Blastocatellia bacterium]
MMLLAFLQEHGTKAAEAAQTGAAATEATQHAAEAGHAAGGHHVPWLVEQVNHWFGEAVFSIQSQLMPKLYAIVRAHWPGEGKTYEQYLDSGQLPIPAHVVMFIVVAIIAVVILYFLRGKLSAESPTTRQQTFEVGVEAVRSMLRDLVGPHGLKYFPVVATFATLIFISNLMGMLPSIVAIPPTANLNTTLALALCSFLYYNYVGIKENGLFGHIRHFFGPVLFIAPLMFPIEIISNLARILSLSLRLFGNIFGEEQVSGVIGELTPWIVPIFLMPLGLLTAFLQTFIFITLSMIYLGEVTAHHGEHEHGHGEHAAAH